MRAAALTLCLLATLVVPVAAQPAPQQLRWLALGDSYSSGEGVYRAGAGDDHCARSRFAWARLAERWVEAATDPKVRAVFKRFGKFLGPGVGDSAPDLDVDMTFLACSGAETTEQPGDAEDLDAQLAQTTGGYDVITFSFGGNDAQFGPIIEGCLKLGCDESEQQMTARIRDVVAPNLDDAYRKIRAKLAPGGRVIVLGYPRLFDMPLLRASCFGLIPRRDLTMLRRVADALNGTIERLARANGLDYVDVATPFEGRNACGRGIDMPGIDQQQWLAHELLPLEFTPACLTMKWVNGISVGVESGGRIMHSFHPNVCGHVVESLLVAQRVLGWQATGDAPVKPRRIQLYHGGLAVEIGDHETPQYQFGQPAAPVVDHLTQLFGLPGEEDTVPVEHLSCAAADGRMTWRADGRAVLSLLVDDGTLVGYTQHAAHPAITAPDGVVTGSAVWELMWRSGGRLTVTEETGDDEAVVHRYVRQDSTRLGDPPSDGHVRTLDDWFAEITDVQDGPTCVADDSVPPEQYDQGSFYFFTSPDGAYSCGFDAQGAVCQGETSPVPPRPAGCPEQVGWGYGMSVTAAGEVDFACAGGLIWAPVNRNPNEQDKLPDGRSLTALGYTCTAENNGIRCSHDDSGHGFFIAPTTNDRF